MSDYPNDRKRPTIVLDKKYDARTKWVTREYGEFVGKTVKGRGVSYMEHVPIWHYRSPNKEEYAQALAELKEIGS